MKNKSRNLMLVIMIIFISIPSLTGAQTGAFTWHRSGARAQGMGGSFVALANDATASYWNPAGMVQLDQKMISLSYSRFFSLAGLNYGSLVYVYPTVKSGYFGINWSRVGINDIIRSNSNGDILGYSNQSEDVFSFSYANQPFNIISLGLDVSYLRAGPLLGANGYRLSGGILLRPISPLSIGFRYENLKGRLNFENSNKSETINKNLKIGIAGTRGDFILSLELDNLTSKYYQEFHSGIEYWLKNSLAFRTGLWKRLNGNERVQWSAGASFVTDHIQLDYGFWKHPELDYSHIFSVSLKFGDPISICRQYQNGIEFYKKEKFSQAREELESVAKLDHKDSQKFSEISSLLGSADNYYHNGMLDDAKICLDRVLNIDPENPKAQKRYELVLGDINTFLGKSLIVAVFFFSSRDTNVVKDVWENLVQSILNSNRFCMIQRERMIEMLKEKELWLTGLVNEVTARKVANLLAADIAIIGSIKNELTGLEITAQCIDIETGQILSARSVSDGSRFRVKEITDRLTNEIRKDFPILLGDIVSIRDSELIINRGLNQGIKSDDRLIVYREGENVIDPNTGKVLGKRKEILAEAKATVVQASIASLVPLVKEGEWIKEIKVGDKVRSR